jgi:uncharacterized delta-60 repeat protein
MTWRFAAAPATGFASFFLAVSPRLYGSGAWSGWERWSNTGSERKPAFLAVMAARVFVAHPGAGMVKNRIIRIGAALGVAVLAGMLMWSWNRAPSTISLPPASAHTPAASVSLVSAGILRIGLGSGKTFPGGLALQGDGTIVVGATAWPKSGGAVLHLARDGRPAYPAVKLLSDAPTTVSSVSTAFDGTVVVAGFGAAAEQETPGPATDRHFILARLLPSGVLDPLFGGSAVLANMRSSMWLGDSARAVALQSDGRILVTGSAGYATGPLSQASYCATARFSRDGRFDRSFGDHGRVLTLAPGEKSCGAVSVLVAPDGKIIVVGNSSAPGIALLRYLPNGAPDRRFGRDGAIEFFDATAGGAALDSQGRTLVVGKKSLSPTSSEFLVARYDIDGKLDQSFGASGAVLLHDSEVPQDLSAAALEQDGKIVAVGTFGWHSAGRVPKPGWRDQIVVVRLDANGALDKSFAEGGLLLIPSTRYLWSGRGIAIDPHGNLLIVGGMDDEASGPPASSIVLIRLNPDGTPDAEFGSGAGTP